MSNSVFSRQLSNPGDFTRQRSHPPSLSDFNGGPPIPPPPMGGNSVNSQRDNLDFDPCEIAMNGLKSLQLEKELISPQPPFKHMLNTHDSSRHENRLVPAQDRLRTLKLVRTSP